MLSTNFLNNRTQSRSDLLTCQQHWQQEAQKRNRERAYCHMAMVAITVVICAAHPPGLLFPLLVAAYVLTLATWIAMTKRYKQAVANSQQEAVVNAESRPVEAIIVETITTAATTTATTAPTATPVVVAEAVPVSRTV